jgi:hypothetical protein
MARKGRTTAMIAQFRRDSVIPRRRHETILTCREAFRKQTAATVVTTGQASLDHVGISPQLHLPRISQTCPFGHGNTGRKAMTEVVTAFLIFVSVGVFLAHAFDAYRLR